MNVPDITAARNESIQNAERIIQELAEYMNTIIIKGIWEEVAGGNRTYKFRFDDEGCKHKIAAMARIKKAYEQNGWQVVEGGFYYHFSW